MTSVALDDAKRFFDALMEHEYLGRGDREKSVRWRLSKRVGVKDSYLYRLQYKFDEMNDVRGEAYRRLKLAYDELCATHEAAADAYATERRDLEHETIKGAATPVEGMAGASKGASPPQNGEG